MTTESVRSILAGGVALATPDNDAMGALRWKTAITSRCIAKRKMNG